MAYFSVTERGTFKRCQRQWRWTSKSGDHLGPIIPPVYLGVGTLIHRASQQWLLAGPTSKTTYAQFVTIAADEIITKAHGRYRTQVGVDMSPEEDDVLYEGLHFAEVMAENYQIRWGSPLPEGFRLIRPEQRVVIPVPGTEHPCELCMVGAITVFSHDRPNPACEGCHGSGLMLHHLDMRFDGLVLDDVDQLHILEHKTYKSRPRLDSLQTNDQFLAYMWGAEQLGVGEVAGLAYDGLWRRDKVPKGKTFEDLFFRTTLTRSRAEFDEFARLLPIELNAMWAARPAMIPFADLPFNRRWEGCYDCKFAGKKGDKDVCRAYSRGESSLVDILLRTQFTTRDDDLDDLDDDPTDAEAA